MTLVSFVFQLNTQHTQFQETPSSRGVLKVPELGGVKADRVRNDVAGWLLMAMIINWCVVLRVQCTLGSTSFFALRFLSPGPGNFGGAL